MSDPGVSARGALTLVTLGTHCTPGVLTSAAWDALRAAEQVVLADGLDPAWQQALDLADVALTASAPGGVDVLALLERSAQGHRLALLGPLPTAAGEDVTRDLLRRSTSGLRAPQVEVVLGAWDGTGAALLELVEVMDRLRSPGGCPWDAEQTHESLLPYALEEAYELVEAVELGDRAHLLEELGDLLLQVVFHARVAQEHPDAPFDVDDVAAGIVTKLRRRHPHVFGDAHAPTAEHVEASWELIKAQEKGRASVLDGVPVAMPALARAHKLLGRAERAGLDVALPSGDAPGDRILREVAATRAAGLEAEQETRAALRRYEERARAVEQGAGPPPPRLRSLAEEMDPGVVAAVDERLAAVVAEHGVAVPLAVEGGSRAWGVPSPGSGYDCRFVYVRPAADYLSPWLHRDVVETPFDGVLDVEGWDLRKALQQLVGGDATVLEWLRSPIAYDVDRGFRSTLLALAEEVVDRDALRRHHLHVGRSRRNALGDGRAVPLGQLLCALRPAVTLRWLREHPEAAVPPTDLPTLLAQVEVTEGVRDLVDRAAVLELVDAELGAGDEPPPAPADTRPARARAAEVFRLLVARFGPPAG